MQDLEKQELKLIRDALIAQATICGDHACRAYDKEHAIKEFWHWKESELLRLSHIVDRRLAFHD